MSAGTQPFKEIFKSYLEGHHLRKTPERFALLDKAMTLQGHFGVDELYDAMEEIGYHVSKATVYSTLELLVDCGLLNRHLFASRKTRYEVAMGNHFHLVCSTCGKITEIESPELLAISDSIDVGDFEPAYYSTVLYGTCSNCSKKKNS